jgi:hypothetical protein
VSDMTESVSDISARAEKRVLDELGVRVTQHRVIARECLTAPLRAEDIAMHEYAAELYEQLVEAAPGVFHDRDQLIADAEATKEGTDAR